VYFSVLRCRILVQYGSIFLFVNDHMIMLLLLSNEPLDYFLLTLNRIGIKLN
jgi:hypothetical protein